MTQQLEIMVGVFAKNQFSYQAQSKLETYMSTAAILNHCMQVPMQY